MEAWWEVPLGWRLVALVLFASVVIGVDAVRGRGRWREYLVLFIGTAIGAGFGVLVDAVTSSISPEYFSYGKGIADGDGFRGRVLALGAQAGVSAGVIVTGVLLVANRDPRAVFSVLRFVALPLGAALAGGVVFGTIQSVWGVVTVDEPVSDIDAFATVWVAHMGVYAGALCGLVVAAIRVRAHSARTSVRADADAPWS